MTLTPVPNRAKGFYIAFNNAAGIKHGALDACFLRSSSRSTRPRYILFCVASSLVPLGAGVSVIAPLPERLPGLIEGSLRPQSQSSFEYSVPGSYLVVTKPSRGLRKSWSALVYG